MALRALVYSKMPLTATALAPVFKGLNIDAEVSNDAFAAISKATSQAFSCVIVDWADQPEAGFLLRRARESALNPNVVAIAIVDREPAPIEIREHRLDSLLYRPITIGEAAAVLAKACQGMHEVKAPVPEPEPEPEPKPELQSPLEQPEIVKAPAKGINPSVIPVTAAVPKLPEQLPSKDVRESMFTRFSSDDEGPNFEPFIAGPSERSFGWQHALAAGLAAAAVFCLWLARDTFSYLLHTREGTVRVLKDSAAAAILSTDATPPVDSEQDAYFARQGEIRGHAPRLRVVPTPAKLPDAKLRQAYDFPLPAPGYNPPKPPPVHVGNVQVPESLKSAPVIGPPVIATGPAQVVPVTAPLQGFTQFHEPVFLTEDTARGMLIHRVDPAYPREAAAQKLQGPVVLEATIGRDGTVEDLKIVRGYFVLSRAAIAAVKQWRFQPYIVNGRAAQTQTTITINFNRPAS